MLTDEWYLVSKIKATGAKCAAFDKQKTLFERCTDVRKAIADNGLSEKHCWNTRGVSTTYADAFTEVYLENL